MEDNSDIIRFYFSLGYFIPNNNFKDEDYISEIDFIKVNLLYKLSLKDKKILVSNDYMIYQILLLARKNKLIKDIEDRVLKIDLNNQSLDEFLFRLPYNNPLSNMISRLLKENCPICLDNINKSFFECGHATCDECCSKIDKCPMCRQRIIKEKIMKEEKKRNKSSKNKSSDKNDDLLKENPIDDSLKKKLIIVENLNEFIIERINKILLKTSGFLSNVEKDELFIFCKYFKDIIIEKCKTNKIQSESLKCFIIGLLYMNNNKELIFKISTPDRLLRFLNTLQIDNTFNFTQNFNFFENKFGDADKTKNIKLNGGGNSYKRDLLNIINNFPDKPEVADQILKSKDKWKSIFSFIHPFEKKNRKKYNNCFNIANSFFNYDKKKKKYSTYLKNRKSFQLFNLDSIKKLEKIQGTIDRKILNKDVTVLNDLLTNPGLSFRMMRRLAFNFQDKNEFKIFVKQIIPLMPFDQKCDLYHVFKNNIKNSNIIITKHQILKWN